MQKRVAVVGGGVAGLTAGYFLSRKYNVTLFEKAPRVGGNAYTFTAPDGEVVELAVAVYSKSGYPLFRKLLRELGINLLSVGLQRFASFHNLDTKKGLYYTLSPRGLLAQRFRLFWGTPLLSLHKAQTAMRKAVRLVPSGIWKDATFKDVIVKMGVVGDSYIILMGMMCLISSMCGNEVLEAPAEFCLELCGSIFKDMFSPMAPFNLYCSEKPTQGHVDALASPIQKIVLNSDVTKITRNEKFVKIDTAADGDGASSQQQFDYVVLACNADQALKMLDKPSTLERQLLSPWRFKDGRMCLHKDDSSFPPRCLQQAYTFLYTNKADGTFNSSVSGLQRFLQFDKTQNESDWIASQHPNFPIAKEKIGWNGFFRTPIYDKATYSTLPRLHELNGHEGLRTYYCGSWVGLGHHEHAVSSAVDIAHMLGVEWN